jgi:hypothetical protein
MSHRTLNIHTARLAAVLLAIGVLFAQIPSIAGADAPPEHGHVMLLGATFEPNPGYDADNPESGPRLFIYDYRRCVDLANNKRLPNHVHHESIHTGAAGKAIETRTGNLVVPLDPITPFESCAHIDFFFEKD